MPATRNILNHIRFEFAVGSRTCDVNSKHNIGPGEKHLAYEQVPGHRKNICMTCTPSILAVAQNHLVNIINQLNS